METRFEIKYRVPPPTADEIRRRVAKYLSPDPHGEGGSGIYDIHSLYLDSNDWRIYRETRAGCYSRFKLRARTYAFEAGAPVFLEVKSRVGESMRKSRVEMGRHAAARALWNDWPILPTSDGLLRFRSKQVRYGAVPRAWVTYRRSAWVGEDRSGLVRVTFDTNIAWAPPTADLSEPARWRRVPEAAGLVVLELKYLGSYPGWAADMLKHFGLERKAMSKYRHAVDALRDTREEAGPVRSPLTANHQRIRL